MVDAKTAIPRRATSRRLQRGKNTHHAREKRTPPGAILVGAGRFGKHHRCDYLIALRVASQMSSKPDIFLGYLFGMARRWTSGDAELLDKKTAI
jgi:hypothetical protein